MKKLVQFLAFIGITLISHATYPEKITALFFDVEAIFQTDSMRASSYVGKIDSLRYLSKVGHLPSQEKLFEALKSAPARSKETTFNKDLKMPLIFSDWLTATQSGSQIKDIIQKYFSHQPLSDIEKKVLFAVVSMMMTPQHLADTQKVSSKIEALLEKLKSHGYKIFLVGNWAHINSLKSEFKDLFKLFHGVYVSGDLHLIKPMEQFYQTVLDRCNVHASQALWIETESKFVTRAKKYGLQVVSYDPDHHDHLLSSLRQHGISI